MTQVEHRRDSIFRLTRRRFLQLVVGGLASWGLLPQRSVGRSRYRVGVGRSSDPYDATLRAIQASEEWPAQDIAGRTVIIKPNLVVALTADTGVTTDPQVVPAIVDRALESDAQQIFIVESGLRGANFSACGYDFFAEYDPQDRVRLVDLEDWPHRLYRVPGGMAYEWIYMPTPLMSPEVFFISVAELKCHLETMATLSMKNLYGVPPRQPYLRPRTRGRFAMHERGVHQTVIDLNLVRPVDFSVVDGVWAMEGDGPWAGTPVQLDTVVAGRNALAVDRACLTAMDVAQDQVQHLTYAATRGLGPSDDTMIDVHGDSLPDHSFVQPRTPPVVDAPTCEPKAFLPHRDQHVTITYRVASPCLTRVEIVRTWDIGPWVRHVRTVRDWEERPAGSETLAWDGRDDGGTRVPPGRYTVRVRANTTTQVEVADPPEEDYAPTRDAYATNWLWVTRDKTYLPLITNSRDNS